MDNYSEVSEWILRDIEQMGLLHVKMTLSDAFRHHFKTTRVFERMVREAQYETVLATIFSVPCQAHYYFHGFAYRPYVKTKSHRPVIQGRLLSDDDLFECRTRLTNIASIKTEDGKEKLEAAVVRAMKMASHDEDFIR